MSTDTQDIEQQKALDHIRELLSAHWREAEDAADDEGKFAVAFKATFDRGAQPTKLKVTCRIAKTISDEIESEIEDPRQQKLLRPSRLSGVGAIGAVTNGFASSVRCSDLTGR